MSPAQRLLADTMVIVIIVFRTVIILVLCSIQFCEFQSMTFFLMYQFLSFLECVEISHLLTNLSLLFAIVSFSFFVLFFPLPPSLSPSPISVFLVIILLSFY